MRPTAHTSSPARRGLQPESFLLKPARPSPSLSSAHRITHGLISFISETAEGGGGGDSPLSSGSLDFSTPGMRLAITYIPLGPRLSLINARFPL